MNANSNWKISDSFFNYNVRTGNIASSTNILMFNVVNLINVEGCRC